MSRVAVCIRSAKQNGDLYFHEKTDFKVQSLETGIEQQNLNSTVEKLFKTLVVVVTQDEDDDGWVPEPMFSTKRFISR